VKIEDIGLNRAYRGGKNNDIRIVINWGADESFVVFGRHHKQLPLGGFVRTSCISTANFAKWATSEVPVDGSGRPI
jgi:hypothetical protein